MLYPTLALLFLLLFPLLLTLHLLALLLYLSILTRNAITVIYRDTVVSNN